MSSKFMICEKSEITKREKIFIDIFERHASLLILGLEGENSWSDIGKRKVMIGKSTTAAAWTDGSSYIAFDRRFIAKLGFNTSGIFTLFSAGLHEYCHGEPDSESHIHGLDFYKRFHDGLHGAIDAASLAMANLAGILESHGKKMDKDILRQKGIEGKIGKAINGHVGLARELGVVPIEEDTDCLIVAQVKEEELIGEEPIEMTKKTVQYSDNPYNPTKSYGILFDLASDFITKGELLSKASEFSGKDIPALAMSLQVLMNPKHKSNGNRSKVEKDGTGRIRLVKVVVKTNFET
jgi:hypothetical protein